MPFNEIISTLPSGTWGATSRVNNQWFVSGKQSTQADYLAVSSDGISWTKRGSLPSAGVWSAMQYQNGIYAMQAGNIVAHSTDAINWSSSSISFSRGSIFGAAGRFIRATETALYYSTDAANWTQVSGNHQVNSIYFGYANSTYFAAISNGMRTSTDGINWSAPGSTTFFSGVETINGQILSPALFNGSLYFGRSSGRPIRYTNGSWSSVTITGSGGGQIASNGNVLVFYGYTNGSTTQPRGIIWTSTNGTNWIERPLPMAIPSGRIGTLFYANGQFVLLMQVAFSNGQVISGLGNVVFTSTDGIVWNQETRSNGTPTVSFDNFFNSSTFAGQISGTWSAITFDMTTTTTSTTSTTTTGTGTTSTTTTGTGTTSTTTTGTSTSTTTTTANPCDSQKQFLKIQLRRGSESEFVSSNPILASGEPAYSVDTNILKIGNGVDNWLDIMPVNVSGNYSLVGHGHTSSDITDFDTSVYVLIDDAYSSLIENKYALLDSPNFTGIPLVPTASSGTNTNQIASTEYVRTEISNLVDSAPDALNTLNELAIALSGDNNFSSTVINLIANKVSKDGDTMTGGLYAPSGYFASGLKIGDNGVGISSPSGRLHIIDSGIALYVGKYDNVTNGGKVRIFVDDEDTQAQGIKTVVSRSGVGNHYAINGTAYTLGGGGSGTNVGLYGYAGNGIRNWGLWVNAGQSILDDKVGIKNQNPIYDLDVIGSGNFSQNLYINQIPVSVSGHSHAASNISDFNSGVLSAVYSGVIPLNSGLFVKTRTGGTLQSTTLSSNDITDFNDTPIFALGNVSGSNAINFGADRLIQTLTLGGTSTTFTKGTGWPSSSVSRDIVLRITVTSATSITWTIVSDWFSQPPAGALSIGTHLFLLRAIGDSTIEGHYIGNKTN